MRERVLALVCVAAGICLLVVVPLRYRDGHAISAILGFLGAIGLLCSAVTIVKRGGKR